MGQTIRIPKVLSPLPEKYADSERRFQGIPSLAVTDNNTIWATWYTGGVTEDRDNYVVVCRSRDGGKTWTKPLFAIDDEAVPRMYDPSLFYAPDGKLHLYWAVNPGRYGNRADLWTMTAENPNSDSPKWSEPQFVCDGIMMNKPIVDSKNRWILPVSVWTCKYSFLEDRSPQGPGGAWFVVTEDQGKTYKKLGRGYTPLDKSLFDEHSIMELRDGRFWLVNRTQVGIGEFFSSDGGKTWTDFRESPIKHTSSRFFLRRLQSGNLLLVKNGPIDQNVGRSRMMAFLSKDDGKSWQGGLMLDERNQVSYPDGDQTPDGTIYIIYDWERLGAKEILCAKITEEDILAGKTVNPKSRLKILVNKATASSVRFVPNPNKNGKPFRSGPQATFEPVNKDEGKVSLFESGCKLFGNRNYTLLETPDYLKGKHFIFSNRMEKTVAKCQKDGMLYILTPTTARNKHSMTALLLKSGFELVAKPEILLFGEITGNIVTVYQKNVTAGETIEIGMWGVMVF